MHRIQNRLYTVIIIISLITNTVSAQIEVNGIYRGENIYVLNPLALGGVGFCVYEVTVNGDITTDEINSNAFEIDLSSFNFKHGDQVKIKLQHKHGCTPKILNPEVLQPKSTYILQSISVSSKGYLTWSTKEEKGSIPFIVEQYRWNKWIRIGTINGKGEPKLNRYYKSVNFHSGTNKFRVKQVDYTRKARVSKSAEYRNLAAPITFIPGNGKKTRDNIVFSSKTKYEIYNHYGTLVKRGTAKTVNVSKLKEGNYFLNYDNSTAGFVKK